MTLRVSNGKLNLSTYATVVPEVTVVKIVTIGTIGTVVTVVTKQKSLTFQKLFLALKFLKKKLKL